MMQFRVSVIIDAVPYPSVIVRLDPPTSFPNGAPKGGATKADIIYAAIGALTSSIYPTPEALRNRLRLEGAMIYQLGKSVPMSLCTVVGKPIALRPMDAFSVVENFEDPIVGAE